VIQHAGAESGDPYRQRHDGAGELMRCGAGPVVTGSTLGLGLSVEPWIVAESEEVNPRG
jgi:hypothetical protein